MHPDPQLVKNVPANSLTPGTRLGDHEILKLLGAGGMGEVFRARDTRLHRDVAIKVLPASFSRDPERLRRFEQEARAAAALNHPNVLAVFQLGTYEGSPYLVSELLDGSTLREQLVRGPLSPRKAVDYGVQIARGLAAAHEKGIAHRDLKPENLFVTKDGRVKILDFGLAKLTQAPKHSAHTAPTVGSETDPGIVVGTVGYMAPEQVRGHVADHRSDIFAFGAILYEMLTGRRAFQKPTSAETMSAILNEEPPAASQVTQAVPPALQRVVNRCLEKSPEQRFQSASDLAFALDALSESGSTAPQIASEPASSSRSRISTALIVVLSLLLLGLLSFKFFATSGPAIDTRNVTIRKLTEHGQAVPWACISPDGKLVAYIKREKERSLRVIQISTGSEVVVVPPQPGYFGSDVSHAGIAFSPDASYVYYTHYDPVNENVVNIYSVPALGGPVRRLVTDVASGMALSADGTQMVYWRNAREGDDAELVVANSDGSDQRVIFHDRSTYSRNTPSWSNAKNLIAIARYEPQNAGASSIHVLTPSGRPVVTLSLPIVIWNLEWRRDSSGLFVLGSEGTSVGGQIWFQPYPKGNPVRISNDLSSYRSLSATADGQSLLSTEEQRSTSVYVSNTPTVMSENSKWNFTAVPTEGVPGFVSWSADGKLLEAHYGSRLYIMSADGGSRTRLLGSNDLISTAVACGPKLVISGRLNKEENAFHLWRSSVSGEDAKQITFGKNEQGPASCTPDGKWVVYEGLDSKGIDHIFKMSVEGGDPVDLARGDVSSPAVSPNGELVAYEKNDGTSADKKPKILVKKLSDGQVVGELEGHPGPGYQFPGWTPDGRAITYLEASSGSAVNIFMQPLNGSRPVQLTHFDSEPSFVESYAWSRDGRKLAVTRMRYNNTDVVLFSGFR